MHKIKQLRAILESRRDVREMLPDTGLPLRYAPLIMELGTTSVPPGRFRPLNLKEVDDILLAYWAGRYTEEQLQRLKTALLKDDSTAIVFIKRLHDHERHIQSGIKGDERIRSLDILLKRGKGLYVSGPVLKKMSAVWLLPVAAILLIMVFLPRHSIYNDFNFDHNPPLMYQTDAQRNIGSYEAAPTTAEDTFFVNGMKAYLACDYEQALNLWSRHPVEDKYKRQLRLYSALSYIGLILSEKNKGKDNTKNISRAVELFQSLEGDMSGYERYFYAMALILAGRNPEARQQLNLIREPDMLARVQALSSYLD